MSTKKIHVLSSHWVVCLCLTLGRLSQDLGSSGKQRHSRKETPGLGKAWSSSGNLCSPKPSRAIITFLWTHPPGCVGAQSEAGHVQDTKLNSPVHSMISHFKMCIVSRVCRKNGGIVRNDCDCLPFAPPSSPKTRLMSKISIYKIPRPSCSSDDSFKTALQHSSQVGLHPHLVPIAFQGSVQDAVGVHHLDLWQNLPEWKIKIKENREPAPPQRKWGFPRRVPCFFFIFFTVCKRFSLVLLHPVEEAFQDLSQLVHCCHVDRRLHQGHYATSLRTEKRFHSKPVFGNEK